MPVSLGSIEMKSVRAQDGEAAREVFLDALERSAKERDAFLDEACAGMPKLRKAVDALLANHKEDAFLEAPAFSTAPPTVSLGEIGEKPGQKIGSYKLLQQIGEGGIGVVFMAEQEEPVRRRVALKVLRPGMDTKSVISRFESERQALALMDHPNIAKVLDAGATEAGRPFFVMDLVRGVSITDFCDENRLPTAERLALFITVCHAIQHAHQKGIIHRDIKPSNVLVTLHDDVPVPKVIDFGIAKAIDQRLSDKTCFTEFHAFIGTPAYVSPEQAEMSGLDVDTRADIYSLGVLLYELLTGKTPFDGKELWSSGLDTMRRTIREQEPASPSSLLATMQSADRTTAAERQRTEWTKLTGVLRGDLDWIVLKALEKDRTRRYATASDLALDIRRYLENETVLARPPSAAYRFRKLVRRNRLLFAGIGAFIAALVLGLGIATWQFVEKGIAYRRAVAAEQEQSRLRGDAEEARKVAEAQSRAAKLQAYAADMNLAQSALNANNLGRARALLASHSDDVELQGWEWRYLWQQCRSDALFTLNQFADEVSELSVSHDGKWVAVGQSRDIGLVVWDLRARREVARFASGRGFAFSPAGPLLAFYADDSERERGPRRSSSGRVILWNVETGQIEGEVPASGSRALAFSGDGTRLLTEGGRTEFVTWDVATKKELARVEVSSRTGGFRRGIYGDQMVATEDLTLAAQAVGGGTVRLVDLVTGEERWTVRATEESVTDLAFSPDGKTLASAAGFVESEVRLWDVADGTERARLSGHRAFVRSLAFDPSGKWLASGSADQTIKLWDVQELDRPLEPGTPARAPAPSMTLRGHRLEVWGLVFSRDGATLVSGCKDGTVCVWDTTSVQRPDGPVTLPTEVRAWRFLPDSTAILALDGSGNLARFGGADFQQRETLLEIGEGVRGAQFSDDTRFMAVVSRNGNVQIWDLVEGVLKRELPTGESREAPLGFLGNSHHIVSSRGREGTFRTWDVTTGEALREWKSESGPAGWNSTLSPDGRSFVGFGRDGSVQLGSLEPGTEPGFEFEVRQPSGAAFSPDGGLLAVTSVLGHCDLLDVRASRKIATLRGFLQGAHAAAFSPDGRRLAIGSNANEAVKLWDVESGRELLTLKGSGSLFGTAAFSPDGNVLAACNGQGILHVWSAPEPESDLLSEIANP